MLGLLAALGVLRSGVGGRGCSGTKLGLLLVDHGEVRNRVTDGAARRAHEHVAASLPEPGQTAGLARLHKDACRTRRPYHDEDTLVVADGLLAAQRAHLLVVVSERGRVPGPARAETLF